MSFVADRIGVGQSGDAGSNLQDNDYTNIEVGGAFDVAGKPVVVKLGQETLGGNGVNALQTLLATAHAFNGWADKFVGAPGGSATPAGGLKDTSVTLVVKGLMSSMIGPIKRGCLCRAALIRQDLFWDSLLIKPQSK